MIMELAIKYWKQIAYITFLAFIFAFGYYKGYQHEKVKLDAIVQDYKREQQIAEIQNAEKAKRQEQITTNVAKEYANAVDKLNKYYANVKWVQPNNSASCKVSDISASTSGVNEATESNQSNTAGVTPLDCANDVMQLLSLQKWINEQVKD